MRKKTALITGVTGQDGSYLTDFLLKKNYKVIGVKRRSSSFNTKRIDHVYNDVKQTKNDWRYIKCKISKSRKHEYASAKIRPDLIYGIIQ